MREPAAVVVKPRPFLKWAGGKSRTAASLVQMAPPYTGRYWEPFMGSAAVFFELLPESSFLSDLNEDLAICFQEVAEDPFRVMDLLDRMPNTRSFYMRTRHIHAVDLPPPERAARVIYLNKTSFRGLWRVNRKGQFNVPYGDYDRRYYDRDNLLQASKALSQAEISCRGYEDALEEAQAGDWVYLDPPYVPDRPWGDFKRYTPEQFHEKDHRRMAELMSDAAERGVFLMLTNSNTPLVRQLFSDWHVTELATRRDIHLKSSERASQDLVITNFAPFREPRLPL